MATKRIFIQVVETIRKGEPRPRLDLLPRISFQSPAVSLNIVLVEPDLVPAFSVLIYSQVRYSFTKTTAILGIPIYFLQTSFINSGVFNVLYVIDESYSVPVLRNPKSFIFVIP